MSKMTPERLSTILEEAAQFIYRSDPTGRLSGHIEALVAEVQRLAAALEQYIEYNKVAEEVMDIAYEVIRRLPPEVGIPEDLAMRFLEIEPRWAAIIERAEAGNPEATASTSDIISD